VLYGYVHFHVCGRAVLRCSLLQGVYVRMCLLMNVFYACVSVSVPVSFSVSVFARACSVL